MATLDERMPTDLPEAGYLVGDLYSSTADLSVGQIAEALADNITALQADGMLPRATVQVQACDSGSMNVLLVSLSDVTRDLFRGAFNEQRGREVAQSVFELAGLYNRVERGRPDRCRFIVQVEVIDDGTEHVGTFIGTMPMYP